MSDVINLEMSLPFITDIELVAIGAIHKIAEHINIDESLLLLITRIVTQEIHSGFEHCSTEPKKIHLKFYISEKSIIMFVDDKEKLINFNTIGEN